jgi:cytochrome c peroxidase
MILQAGALSMFRQRHPAHLVPLLVSVLLLAPAANADPLYPNYGQPPSNAWFPEPAGLEGFQLAPPYTTDNPFSAAELEAIANGFDLFKNETFDGNGRTCATCHVPDRNYNLALEDFQALSLADQQLVLGGTNPHLENSEAVEEKVLFNINQSAGPGSEGDTWEPPGPFRSSMSLGGLGLTVLNNHVCWGSTANGFGLPVTDNGCPGNLTGSNSGVDDGVRDLMLGWSGEGPLAELFPWWDGSELQLADCDGVIEEFTTDRHSLRDLHLALATFALAAVKTHFPVTQNREPGVDFRCPTQEELLDMAAFQKWLGRRFELDINQLKFKDYKAQKGRNLFASRVASCVACHVNAGAGDTQGRVKSYPVPFLTVSGQPDYYYNVSETAPVPPPEDEPLFLIGTNKTSRNGSQLLELDFVAQFESFEFPFDAGDHQLRSGVLGQGQQGGFNVQSLIEAVRNKQFFHNNGVTGTIEDAIEFYFTPAFKSSQGGNTISNEFRRSDPHNPATVFPTAAEARAFLGGDQAIANIGLFLRSLAAIYAFADCERFIDELADRAALGLPLGLPSDHCRFALADVRRLFTEVPVPRSYRIILLLASTAQSQLTSAENTVSLSGKLKKLKTARSLIASSRRSLATTPELY